MHFSDLFRFWSNISSRYFLVAGLAFLLFYVLILKIVKDKKIQKKFPETKEYLREIGYSVTTTCIFAIVPWVLIKHPAILPHTTLYQNITDYGWIWFILAFPVMFLMHDTYFYWTHRMMHHPRLFKHFHLVHHKSTNPSPWAAYAFHPLEAVVEAGIFVVFLFTIPMHKLHFFLFFLMSIIYNVYGHLGWELYPKGFSKHWLGKWINTSVNHNQHHQYFKGNYGLYFLIWDRIMGTVRSDYDKRYDEVKNLK